MSELFGAVFSRGRTAEAVSDEAWLGAMLRVEAALAESAADAGLVSADAAKAVAAAAALEHFDPADVAASAARIGNPVAGVVDRLKELVPERHHEAVHYRATSQDILDTAMMLVAREAMRRLGRDCGKCITAAAVLEHRHGDQPMWGRTLLQQAEPVGFGNIAQAWATCLGAARAACSVSKAKPALTFRVAYGGPVGRAYPTRSGPYLGAVAKRLAERLELDAEWEWRHTDRSPVVRIGAAAAEAAGAIGKVAVDIILLSQNEIGEVGEARGGGSTSMPHKRNPVAATAARACAARTPGLVATLFAAMPQELQRSPGLWHSEWETLSDLLRLTGSAAAWLRESLEGLRIHPDAMERNLGRSVE